MMNFAELLHELREQGANELADALESFEPKPQLEQVLEQAKEMYRTLVEANGRQP